MGRTLLAERTVLSPQILRVQDAANEGPDILRYVAHCFLLGIA